MFLIKKKAEKFQNSNKWYIYVYELSFPFNTNMKMKMFIHIVNFPALAGISWHGIWKGSQEPVELKIPEYAFQQHGFSELDYVCDLNAMLCSQWSTPRATLSKLQWNINSDFRFKAHRGRTDRWQSGGLTMLSFPFSEHIAYTYAIKWMDLMHTAQYSTATVTHVIPSRRTGTAEIPEE